MAFLGHASAQMSHDLRNPLAALKGAIQYLEADLEHRSDLADHLDYLRLMADQVGRIERSVERYGHMACTQAHTAPEALNQIVERVSALQPFAATGIAIETRLDARVPPLLLDAELLFPRPPQRRAKCARGQRGRRASSRFALSWSVTASSSASRTLAAAWMRGNASARRTNFFTTKANGSGLGLAFAKRVAEAHAGTLRIRSKLNQGTSVVFDLPAKPSTPLRQSP